MISPTPWSDDDEVMAFQPAFDINLMSVKLLMSKIDTYGSENFRIDKDIEFSSHWVALMRSRESFYNDKDDQLLKDL